MTEYTFGDSELARERLALVADTFAAPTRALLADLPALQCRYVIDMGCGPGYTSALLLEAFPHSYVTGYDASPAMIDEAKTRTPAAKFAIADVTAPVKLPAHVIYSRLLLGHLRDPAAALVQWAAAMRPGGAIVCEEPARYRSDNALFARYEEVVTEVVAARGAMLWAAPALDAVPPQCAPIIDRVIEHPVPAARAAAMFWRNARTWGGDPELVDGLRAIDDSGSQDVVMWELRQVAWLKQ